jgi:hypothetical protein
MTSVNRTPAVEPGEEALPPFSVQVAQQLGGVRGMVESSVPVVVFVLINIIWSLTPAVIASVTAAIGIAIYRLAQKESIRHALNGLFGIAIGAFIAYRTGEPQDFYLPGIVLSLVYGLAMIGSVIWGRPLVGWLWSLVADLGSTRWRDNEGLRRTFGWLTLVWAATYLLKVAINCAVYFSGSLTPDEKSSILGVMRILLGFPPYALLLAVTIWAVRRHLRAHEGEAAPLVS